MAYARLITIRVNRIGIHWEQNPINDIDMDKLSKLTSDIRANGLHEKIVVYKSSLGHYFVADGVYRLLALRNIDKTKSITVLVVSRYNGYNLRRLTREPIRDKARIHRILRRDHRTFIGKAYDQRRLAIHRAKYPRERYHQNRS